MVAIGIVVVIVVVVNVVVIAIGAAAAAQVAPRRRRSPAIHPGANIEMLYRETEIILLAGDLEVSGDYLPLFLGSFWTRRSSVQCAVCSVYCVLCSVRCAVCIVLIFVYEYSYRTDR